MRQGHSPIGLGEAGEHIVRAALAKMLNNYNDSRCRNLNGLGIDVAAARRFFNQKEESFDFAVPEGEKAEDYAELTGIFDQANLLAINAGPEQKAMLAQPYNYIWGTQGSGGTSVTSTINPHYHQWATNCVFVDINKEGSGGKMGKGRAYAVRGESGIKDALRSKREQKNIRQVCIVHSFAGGSGSGMILPILRMVKQVMPSAMVWVFSAGETQMENQPTMLKTSSTSQVISFRLATTHYTIENTRSHWIVEGLQDHGQ